MAINATFAPAIGEGGFTLENIEGYRMSAFFHPANGFNGNFYVYVQELISDQDDFKSVNLAGNANGNIVGILSFTDHRNQLKYTFNEIDFIRVLNLSTQQQKERLLVFHCRAAVTGKKNSSYCTLNNTSVPLNPQNTRSRMGQKYMYRITGADEPLLSFNNLLGTNFTTIFQFQAYRNTSNSFMDLCMTLDKERMSGGIQPKNISVAILGAPIMIDDINLQGILVDESYGGCLKHRLNIFNLGLIAQMNNNDYASLIDYNISAHPPGFSLDHSTNPKPIQVTNVASSIETATIILQPGYGLDLSKQII